MAIQTQLPPAVCSITDLTPVEIERYTRISNLAEQRVRQDQLVPREALEAMVEATARAIHKIALDRGFYNEQAAQHVEIDVNIVNRIVVQKTETLKTVVEKSIIQVIFGTLGWVIAESNPIIGIPITAVGFIASSDACKGKVNRIYGKE